MSTAEATGIERISVAPAVVDALISAVESCYTMCDTKIKPVGVSTIPGNAPGPVTGMIGVHGQVSGFVTVNMAERASLQSVGGLLQEEFSKLNAQVVDGVGEITNIIAGGIKNKLAKTEWAFTNLTVPSVIIGENYNIAYSRGLLYTALTFEVEDENSMVQSDQMVQVSVSLIRL